MIRHDRSGTRRRRFFAPFAALLVVGAATLVLASPAGADDPAFHDPPNFTDTGAFGYSAAISLFRGPINKKGPEPVVSLPAAGSTTPITAEIPKGKAQFGPAVFIDSGPMKISTSGTPDGTVTASTDITGNDPNDLAPILMTHATSTCSATGSTLSGTTTLAGELALSTGADGTELNDKVTLPANPAPNSEERGELTNVGDKFRIVLNEQINTGSLITVNAIHLYALGDVAIGDLIIGQVRCAATTSASGAAGGAGTTQTPAAGGSDTGGTGTDTGGTGTGGTGTGGTGTGGSGTGGSGTGGSGMPNTGTEVLPLVVVGLELLGAGSLAVRWSTRRRPWPHR